MKDEESLNPDDTFCQAQVDVQKMIDQLKQQAEAPQNDDQINRKMPLLKGSPYNDCLAYYHLLLPDHSFFLLWFMAFKVTLVKKSLGACN